MTSTLENLGLALYFLNQNIIYLVYVRLKKAFSVLTFNPASNIFCERLKSSLVITSMFSLYLLTISNPLNSFDIFSWGI